MRRPNVLESLVATILIVLVFAVAEFAKAKVNVEIYMVEGELIYCATGSLVPPAVHLGSGSITKGKESYC